VRAAAPGGAHPALGALLRYGLRRTPGDIALPALFAFPTFAVAAALPGRPEAGYVGFATSAITLICSVFGMLTPVLLPRLSGRFHTGADDPALHRGLLVLPLVAAGLAAALTATIMLAAAPLVHGFLGPEFGGAVPSLRLGLLAAVPLAMYYAARPTLDALHEAPVTTGLLLGCLAAEVGLTFALGTVLSPPVAAVTALGVAALVLGASSYLVLVRALARRSAA
jgi:O-antigen/teichoic acid export membrane protein